MKKRISLICFLLFAFIFSYGQKIEELYNNRDYKALVKYKKKSDDLTGEELYMIGYAFFQLENDAKAIECYDKAIAKGYDNGGVHFYKGLSLNYQKKYDDALVELNISLKKEPTNQEYMNEKGLNYYYQKKYEKSLEVFQEAIKLPATFPDSWYWVAGVYHEIQKFDTALAAYYEALKHLPKENSYYLTSLKCIGQLEYTHTKDYLKSAKAYTEAIEIDPTDYELKYKLMKSYNAAKEYSKADSIFNVVKKAFEKGELPKEDMEIKTIAIAQFEWNGQVAVIRRSLVDPKEMLDISYKVFLLDKEGENVVRRFVIEKTLELEKGGAKHLLCEQDKKTGDHITYPYGWTTDTIPLDDLEMAVKLVLDGKMKSAASSHFGK